MYFLHFTAVLVWLLDIHILCMNVSKKLGQLQLTRPDSTFILVFVSGRMFSFPLFPIWYE